MTQFNEFKPSVHTELEDWDDTSDSIVWIIENIEDYHLTCPKLELDEAPQQYHGSSRFETPTSQKATLTGWTKEHHKVLFVFYADFTEIPNVDGVDGAVDGYIVTVEKEDETHPYRMKPYKKYTVKGYDRKSFEIV